MTNLAVSDFFFVELVVILFVRYKMYCNILIILAVSFVERLIIDINMSLLREFTIRGLIVCIILNYSNS